MIVVAIQRFDNVQMCRKSFRRWTSGSFQSSHGYISRHTESDIRLLPSQSPSVTFTLLKDLGNNRFPSKYGRGGGEEGKIPQCDLKNHVGFLSTPLDYDTVGSNPINHQQIL